MSSSADPSHAAVLADSLQRLQQQQEEQPPVNGSAILRGGYGFRRSGLSTPQIQSQHAPPDELPSSTLAQDLLVPDPNGLGWPGAFSLGIKCLGVLSICTA